MKTTKVKVLRPFYYDRTLQAKDKIIVLPALFAMEVIAANKAVLIDEPVQQKSAGGALDKEHEKGKKGGEDAGK